MVKAISYTLVAVALCVGLFIFSEIYIKTQFKDFGNALDALYLKIEDETATCEDAKAVRTLWNDKKSKLQVLLPHNDISYIDYWISEACGLLYNEEYELALGKVEVLIEITKNLPDAYLIRLENIF